MASEMRLIWSEPGCEIAQISGERVGAAAGDEMAVCGHVGMCSWCFSTAYGYGKGGHM